MLTYLRAWLDAHASERGASAVEYALVLAGVAAVLIGVLNALGDAIGTIFSNANAGLND